MTKHQTASRETASRETASHQTASREKASRETWLSARLALLEAEKALTRQSDAVARQRQALPWVAVDTAYRFDTEDGTVGLEALFQGRSQLLVYHFMFGPDFQAGCISCSAIADGFDGIAVHLAHHDTMLWAVSRAPLAKLLGFRGRMGWRFPWASAVGDAFNHDFGVSITAEAQREGGSEYNYRRGGGGVTAASLGPKTVANAALAGAEPLAFVRERPGMSAFVLEEGVVYHTYSTYARGLDGLWGMYQWLDRAPKGRNESGVWWRHHDRYDAVPR